MKSNSETKLLLILGAIAVLGGGALFGLNRQQNRPIQEPKPTVTSQEGFNDLLKDARHEKGSPDAKLTIVEFGDFECDPCRRAYTNVTSKLEKIPDIRFVYRHLPLEMHPSAIPAAIASEAAARQGKFWEMYSVLFSGPLPPLMDDAYLRASARKAGRDLARFERDRKDAALKDLVEADMALAERLKISSTPSFFIKDESGKVSYLSRGDDLKALLEKKRLLPAAPSPVADGAQPGPSRP